jgi:hypothetical protein
MSKDVMTDPFGPAIAAIEAKIAQLQETLATLKTFQSGSPAEIALIGGTKTTFNKPQETSLTIDLDSFHNMTLSQAIKKYLSMRWKKPATTNEIVEALRTGGQAGAEGDNFSVVVNNSLNRMSAADGIVSKVRRGIWGLKEWYETKSAE